MFMHDMHYQTGFFTAFSDALMANPGYNEETALKLNLNRLETIIKYRENPSGKKEILRKIELTRELLEIFTYRKN